MASTYEMIRDLPGKSTNWRRLVDALVAHYVTTYKTLNNGVEPYPVGSIDTWTAAKGIREMRRAAMEAANFTVGDVARRVSFIPPSDESMRWDHFEGGHRDVYYDREAEAAATDVIAGIIAAAA